MAEIGEGLSRPKKDESNSTDISRYGCALRLIAWLDRMIHLRRPQQRFQPAERYRVGEPYKIRTECPLAFQHEKPGEAIAAAGDTFHLTICPECDGRTRRKAGGRGWTGAQAPKMPCGIRKTNSNTPFGGEGTGIFP